MANPGFDPPPRSGRAPRDFSNAADVGWVTRIVDTIVLVMSGKLNVVLPITLDANAATTTITDARIGYYSALVLQPLTATAALALYDTPYILPSAQNSGSVVLNHSNTADTDRNFNLVILG